MDVAGSLRESITVKSVTSRSAAGDPVYGSGVSVAARVERLTEVAASSEGTNLVESTRLFTLVALKKSDLVFLAGESTSDDDVGHNVTRVEVMRDLDGVVSHYESYF